MRPTLTRLWLSIALLLVLCALISCEDGETEKNSGETAAATEEITVTEHVEADTRAESGDAIPNLPEDGYTKLY
ncbi:MAG: hypothetical protein IKJ35_04275 [Clostridia bacterium]|nr:hypothetical protein [Clostridia bacterium]